MERSHAHHHHHQTFHTRLHLFQPLLSLGERILKQKPYLEIVSLIALIACNAMS